ncbi:hypothetical protein TWF696_000075 [Orbilia brochopaga]|uniref:NAD(P)-binding protein n=1 Tax=Orbilia brochopaga TaxID=3140254 RepID=A0AAV9VDA7_9PEZI
MAFTPHFDAAAIPDLTGKVAIVTGANVGIGFETAYFLASRNATVYVAARNEQRALAAIDRLHERLKAEKIDARLLYHHLDLASVESARRSAEDFLAKEDRLDILICNAGVMGARWTPEIPYEPMFLTNHIGHFVFVTTVLPLIEKTALQTHDARIVITTSESMALHKTIDYEAVSQRPADADVPRGIRDWPKSMSAYGRSKLANVWFAKELDVRVRDKGIWVNAAHPGLVGATELGQEFNDFVNPWISKIAQVIVAWLFMSPKDGAATQTYLATSPDVPAHNVHGRYYYARMGWLMGFKGPVDYKLDPAYENEDEWRRLWDWTEDVVQKELAK